MTNAITFDYQPIPVHEPFHRSTAYERCLFGAFGSGKTYSICAEAIAFGLEQPGSRILITRRTIPELRDTTETVFFDILPSELFRAGEAKRIGGHFERFTLPNGTTFLFRSIDDWIKHKSLNVAAIAWDELDEFDEETYLGMLSRIRQKEPTKEGREYGAGPITRRGTWSATNPNGHDWTWRRFVNPDTRQERTEAFFSTSFDNPHLPPEYLQTLLSYPEPWIRRYVLCQFDDFAGQIYEDWAWDTHVVDPLGDYGAGPVFWMALDPGTRSPTAGLWAYLDRENHRLVGIAEYEETSLAASEHAKSFRSIEGKHKMRVQWRVADPNSITVRDRGSNMGLDTQYARLGFNFALGPRNYKDRIPMLGQLITNKQFVVTKDCPRTYEAIKNYQWADLTPHMRAQGIDAPEKPLKRNDHLVDCAQYLSSRYVKPLGIPKPKAEMTFSEEVSRNIRRKLMKQGRIRYNHDLGGITV